MPKYYPKSLSLGPRSDGEQYNTYQTRVSRNMGGRDSISKGDVDDQIDNGKTGL
jgi:hypothetical protein